MSDGGRSEAQAAGLVTSTTSDTPRRWQHSGRLFRSRSVISKDQQRRARLLRTKKTVITGARLAVEEAIQGGFRGRWAMVTLTYRDDVRWKALQLTGFLKAMRQYATRAAWKPRYVWALELTKRGRPHYHVLVWLPKGRTLPKPDKRGWWVHGMTKVEWARNAVGYLAKYASKGIEDGQWCLIPSGARMCGHGGLSDAGRIELRWWKLPVWVREHWPEIQDVIRTKGGFVQRPTGEFLASPYMVAFIGGALVLMEAVSEQP